MDDPISGSGDSGGSGELDIFFAALGRGLGTPELDAALALVGPGFRVGRVTRDARGSSQYVEFSTVAVDLLLTDGVLSSIFIEVQPFARAPYAGFDRLVPGLAAGTSRAGVRALLGPPVATAESYDLHGSPGRFLHTEYEADGSLTLLTLMARDPAA